MRRIVISPKADLDLDDQFVVIAPDNIEAAERFLTTAHEAFTLLAENPQLGVSVEFKTIRLWPITRFRNHLIFYRPILDGIEIVRVLHAARDWTRVLEDDLDL
ncbi:MAG: type II toxin-antitoxin system RelE/ParE family toxin [Verrucomicrobiota bacterium]